MAVTTFTRAAKGNADAEHIVQLFDGPDSLGESVASFLHEGLATGGNLLVLAKPAHVEAIADALLVRGHVMATLISGQRLTVLDARLTLSSLMRNGAPDPALFDRHIASVVRRLRVEAPLRAYGELVELLAEEGNFRGATELEGLWNQLSAVEPLTLLCGYSSAHFAPAGAGAALRQICGCHSRVVHGATDLLGNWLLSRGGRRAS
jgi:hypothetical protein